MTADERIEAARVNWLSRFVSAGGPVSDFPEVTGGIERWENWCAAWSARAAVHEKIGRKALAAGHSLSAGRR